MNQIKDFLKSDLYQRNLHVGAAYQLYIAGNKKESTELMKLTVAPEQVLDWLQSQNQKFIEERKNTNHPSHQVIGDIEGTSSFLTRSDLLEMYAEIGQFPVATIVGCADSRVDFNCFNAMPGDLFIEREAGAMASQALGTLQYSLTVLKTPLLVVMGHTSCGFAAALSAKEQINGPLREGLNEAQSLIDQYNPGTNDPVTDLIHSQIAAIKEKIPGISELISEQKLKIVGAIYQTDSGKVEFL